jgi:hypothetical protein
VAALFDELEADAGFRRGLNNRWRAGRDKRRKVRSQHEDEGVERSRLVLVRILDFTFARLVDMIVARMAVMMRVQMRVDQWRVIVMIAITVDVLKRRQDKGGRKRQTALER